MVQRSSKLPKIKNKEYWSLNLLSKLGLIPEPEFSATESSEEEEKKMEEEKIDPDKAQAKRVAIEAKKAKA